jgi:type 1 glutamine amidotransferase
MKNSIIMPRRNFLKTAGATGAASIIAKPFQTFAAIDKNAPRGDWFKKNPRVFLLDFQMPDPSDQGVPGMPDKLLEHIDTRLITEQLAEAGVDTILVHAKCNQGNAYYNSKVVHKHSSLGNIDLMADFSKHCRDRGMNLLYYVQLSRERRAFENPQWRARRENGTPVIKEKDDPLLPSREEAPVICLNGPGRQYMKAILGELSANYDFDGYWLDCFMWWANQRVCYCDACRETYRKEMGRELPSMNRITSNPAGRDYLRWRLELNTKIMHEFIDHIQTINPKLTVTHNGAAEKPCFDFAFVDKDDYVCHEFHYDRGIENLSLLCRKNWASKPNTPFEVEIWRFANRMHMDRNSSRGYQVRPVAALKYEMAGVKAFGGFPQYYDQIRWDGMLDKKSLERLKPAFQFITAREQWTGRGEPVPYAGILWSKDSQQLLPANNAKLVEDGMEGTHNALIESHIPVGVITERDAIAGKWRGMKTIVIPSAECLSNECVAALEKYVEAGGGLVVTGLSSMYDATGARRKDFALADLLGINYQRMTETYYTFIQPEKEHPVTKGLDVGFPMTVAKKLQVKVKSDQQNDVLAVIVDPMPGFHMGYPPLKRTDSPSLLTRTVGKGRVVYAAASLGEIYLQYSHPDTRTLICNAVTWTAGSPPPVTAETFGTVEVVPWWDERKNETIIHLLNRTAAGPAQNMVGAMIHETIPVHDVEVSVDRSLAGKRVTFQPSGRAAKTRVDGERLIISVDKLEEWEIIVLS